MGGRRPVRLRYSGASISYTVASILGGGLTPPLATALYARFGTSMAVSALIALVSVISLLAILLAGHRVLRPGGPTSDLAPSTPGRRPADPVAG